MPTFHFAFIRRQAPGKKQNFIIRKFAPSFAAKEKFKHLSWR